MPRAALFASVGVAFFGHWALTDPSFEETPTQSEWNYVLAFSGVILVLAIAIPLLAELVGGRFVFRVSLVAAAGAGLASVANVFEDGLHIEWVFFAFVLGAAIMLLALLILSVAITLAGQGGSRLLALVPLGTVVAILLYVVAGGPLMLATWLTAAALALALPRCTTALDEPTHR